MESLSSTNACYVRYTSPGKVTSAHAAVALIEDGATVGVTGAGGGTLEPNKVLEAVEKHFMDGAGARNLTFVHALGFGGCNHKGTCGFAHEGMLRRVIGGHWGWSPQMRELVRNKKIEACALQSGVVAQLFREIGVGRPGLFTDVGPGTFADPHNEGGGMNRSAIEALDEVVEIDGQEYLRYKPFKVDIAIVRASTADADGNGSLDQEAANLVVYARATAAHNSGGKLIVQVRHLAERDTLQAQSVRILGALVDVIVVDPHRMQNYERVYDPSISGEKCVVLNIALQPFGVCIVARRAYRELRHGAVLSFGFGMPDGVARLITERDEQDLFLQTV